MQCFSVVSSVSPFLLFTLQALNISPRSEITRLNESQRVTWCSPPTASDHFCFFFPSEPLAVLQKSRFSAGGPPRLPEPPAALFCVPFAAVSGDNADQWPAAHIFTHECGLMPVGCFHSVLSSFRAAGSASLTASDHTAAASFLQISVDVMCCNVDLSELALQNKMLSWLLPLFPLPPSVADISGVRRSRGSGSEPAGSDRAPDLPVLLLQGHGWRQQKARDLLRHLGRHHHRSRHVVSLKG